MTLAKTFPCRILYSGGGHATQMTHGPSPTGGYAKGPVLKQGEYSSGTVEQ